MPRTVLLADDSTQTRRMAGQYLADLGCRLVTAGFGEAAWQALRTSRPDLVIIDARLPGIDGREFRRRMRAAAEWAATPVLLLAGALDTAEPEPGDLGAVLRKPVAMTALTEALARIFPQDAWTPRASGARPAPLVPAGAGDERPPLASPEVELLRRLLGAHLPDTQVEIIVREWERRRRLAADASQA